MTKYLSPLSVPNWLSKTFWWNILLTQRKWRYTYKNHLHLSQRVKLKIHDQSVQFWISNFINALILQYKYFWPKTKNISINLCAALMYKLFYQKKLIRRQWKFCLIRFRIISKIYRCNPFCNLKLIIICQEIQSFVNINKIKMFYLQGVQF